MRGVELQGISNFVCRETDLEILPGELLVVLGPNGAGKTTLLNVIAGLVSYEGTVRFDGVSVDHLPARERRVGYMFQDLVLFPHLTVEANIAYGIRRGGQGRRDRVRELLDLLGIEPLADRYPGTLSGGEKQRAALARALAPRPRILLLDEPFSSLDARTSTFLRAELKHLQQSLGMTTLFVTHDLEEAEQIADRIAVIQDGVVRQVGTPDDVLLSPCRETARDYLGTPNVLECRSSRDLGHGLAEADCNGMPVIVPRNGHPIRRIVVLPRDVRISTHRPPSEVNVFEGRIRSTGRHAGMFLVSVDVGKHVLTAELPRAPFEARHLQQGAPVFVELGLMKLHARP